MFDFCYYLLVFVKHYNLCLGVSCSFNYSFYWDICNFLAILILEIFIQLCCNRIAKSSELLIGEDHFEGKSKRSEFLWWVILRLELHNVYAVELHMTQKNFLRINIRLELFFLHLHSFSFDPLTSRKNEPRVAGWEFHWWPSWVILWPWDGEGGHPSFVFENGVLRSFSVECIASCARQKGINELLFDDLLHSKEFLTI